MKINVESKTINSSKDKNDTIVSFPTTIFIIDEFSYLFKRNGMKHNDFAMFLNEFIKLSRYANTHIILSTQRREKEFITEQDLIYIPTRFIFHCLNDEESKRLILASGAKDLKQGEFLYRNKTMIEPVFCKISNSPEKK